MAHHATRRRLLELTGVMALAGRSLTAAALVRGYPYRIYRVTYRGRTEVEHGFDDYLAGNGIEVHLVERDAGLDSDKIPEFVREIKELRPDLVTTWGTTATLAIAGPYDAADRNRYVTDIPIVFSLVTAPVASRIVGSWDPPGRNVTGAVHVVPTPVQLRAMAAYRPFSRVGILYTESEENAVAIVAELRALQRTMGFTLIERSFPIGPDGRPRADGLERMVEEIAAAGANWLYLNPDTFRSTLSDRIAVATRAAALPCFGTTEITLRQEKAVFGLVCRYYSVGQLAASKAARILLHGEPAATIPIETLKRFSWVVNLPVAHALGLYPPIEMLNYVEVMTG